MELVLKRLIRKCCLNHRDNGGATENLLAICTNQPSKPFIRIQL